MKHKGNISRLMTRMLAFASIRQNADRALSFCVTSSTNSLEDATMRAQVCHVLAREYHVLKSTPVLKLTMSEEEVAGNVNDSEDASPDISNGITCRNAQFAPFSGRPSPLSTMDYKKYSLIVIDAGSIDSSAPVMWKDSADVIVVAIDPTRTTDIMARRLKKEVMLLDVRIDAAIMANFPFFVPGFIYERL